MADNIYDDEVDAESGTFIIHDLRERREIAFEAIIYDYYAPLLGADGLGVYGIYCRIAALPKSVRRRCGQDKIAAAARIGKQKLRLINAMLADLGLIRQVVPDNWRKSRHISTHTFLLTPPDRPSPEMIEKYGPKEYKPLPGWLFDDPSTAGPDRPPVEKAPVQIDRRSESAGPDRPAESQSAGLSRPANGKSAGLSGPAKVHSLTHSVSSSSIDTSKKENLSERVNLDASVMESDDDARERVQAVQLRLLVALQEHGWMGGGWTWNEDEQALVVDAYPDLSQQAIEYAVATWMETVIKGKRREPFHPSRTLPWLIKVCKNFDTTKGFYEFHGSNNTNEAGNGRRSAEQLVPPAPANSSPPEDDEPFDYSIFDVSPSGPSVFAVRGSQASA